MAENFSFIDIIIALVMLLMCVVCSRKGFVRSAISLFFWLLAFFLAYHFAENLGNIFTDYIDNPSIRQGLGFFIIFIFMVLIGVLITYIFSHLVEKGNLMKTDQVLGGLFGIFCGAVLVAILLTLAKGSSLPHSSWWQKSFFISKLEGLQELVEEFIPVSTPPDTSEQEQLGPDGKPIPIDVKNPADTKSGKTPALETPPTAHNDTTLPDPKNIREGAS